MTEARGSRFDPDAILAALEDHALAFVLIGGLAGGARGAGWPTFDVDIVIATDDANLERLEAALSALDAEYDTFHQPPIQPDLRRLRGSHGPQLFRTRYGRLDVLKEAGGETYETLVEDASAIRVHGHTVRCASLEALLRMKRAANRPKDQNAIAMLEAASRWKAQSTSRTIVFAPADGWGGFDRASELFESVWALGSWKYWGFPPIGVWESPISSGLLCLFFGEDDEAERIVDCEVTLGETPDAQLDALCEILRHDFGLVEVVQAPSVG